MWGAISQNIIKLDLELVTGMGRERKRGAREDVGGALVFWGFLDIPLRFSHGE